VFGRIRRLLRPRVPVPPRPAPFACVGLDWNEPAIDAGFDVLHRHRAEFSAFPPNASPPAYGYANPYFSLLDAAVAHSFVREQRFSRIVEIGSGFSSRVLRGALDLNGGGSLLSIDPAPRSPIEGVAHEHWAIQAQSVPLSFYAALPEDSLLFIDSSHKATYGSDVVFLLLSVLPVLKAGVTVHVHDIFLPDEYPAEWHDWDYSEQYVFHALIAFSTAFSVVWPGRYVALSRRPRLESLFPSALIGLHCSFWIRRVQGLSVSV